MNFDPSTDKKISNLQFFVFMIIYGKILTSNAYNTKL